MHTSLPPSEANQSSAVTRQTLARARAGSQPELWPEAIPVTERLVRLTDDPHIKHERFVAEPSCGALTLPAAWASVSGCGTGLVRRVSSFASKIRLRNIRPRTK